VSTRLGTSLPEERNRAGFRIVMFTLKIRGRMKYKKGQNPKKKTVSVNF